MWFHTIKIGSRFPPAPTLCSPFQLASQKRIPRNSFVTHTTRCQINSAPSHKDSPAQQTKASTEPCCYFVVIDDSLILTRKPGHRSTHPEHVILTHVLLTQIGSRCNIATPPVFIHCCLATTVLSFWIVLQLCLHWKRLEGSTMLLPEQQHG